MSLDMFLIPKQARKLQNPEDLIRVDCYYKIVESMKEKFPKAHFEGITREFHRSSLAPSWNLLWDAKKKDDLAVSEKEKNQVFQEYCNKLRKEFEKNQEAMNRIDFLADLVKKGEMVFLICVEKDPKRCHRSFVKKLILERLKID